MSKSSLELPNKIPKILHQIWIGPKPAPTNLMVSWKEKNPDFEYIYWNEAEIAKRGLTFRCAKQIDMISEINGKADIIRWEILYKYGGVFVDADSICIEPFDEYFMSKTAFATYENENVRSSLVATGTMGFVPEHSLCKDIIDWIHSDESAVDIQNYRAWFSVGPACLTRFLNTGKYRDFSVFPSHCFLPIHFTGPKYEGHKKVYGYQEWGTAKQSYDTMNSVVLPAELLAPTEWVSVLVSSYNTEPLYIRECLDSIKMQNGYFGIELVWMNDGSDLVHTTALERELDNFKKTSRFTKVVYEKTETNYGICECLTRGALLCSNEIIFKMDSDDIMLPERMRIQLDFIKKTPDCMICGSSLQFFKNDSKDDPRSKLMQMDKKHPFVFTWTEFLNTRSEWFMNHPTTCFRKSALMEVGNYTMVGIDDPSKYKISLLNATHDYDLELRFLKRWGKVYSLPNVLLYYRIHENQATYQSPSYNPENKALRDQIIEKIISSNRIG